MFGKKTKKTEEKKQDQDKHNLKLWGILALIPVTILVLVFIIGSTSFFGTAYRYDDPALSTKPDNEDDVKEITKSIPPRQNMDTIFQNSLKDASTTASDVEATVADTPKTAALSTNKHSTAKAIKTAGKINSKIK